MTECDFYEGDLLVAVSELPTEFWNENQTECKTLNNLVDKNSEQIRNELGEMKFEKLIKRIKNGT